MGLRGWGEGFCLHKRFLRTELIRRNEDIFFNFLMRWISRKPAIVAQNYGTVKENTKIELKLGTCKKETYDNEDLAFGMS
jgi:hypothetical protein